MNLYRKQLALIIISAALLAGGCTKQSRTSGPYPMSDVRPAIPVTVQNATDYRPDPTIGVPLSGSGAIQIILSIPSGSGRTIKEITKVTASTTYTPIQSSGSTGFYNTAPIAGSGTTVTFNTSLTEYFAKIPVSASNPAAKINTELANRFFFLVTLDDNSTIITESVRILVL